MSRNNDNYYTKLRKQAASLVNLENNNLDELSKEEVKQLFEELNIHQVELELQNEELKLTQCELQQSQQNFSNLFDFAPTGYIRLSENARILQTNQTFAKMLQHAVKDIEGKHFAQFIDERDLALFNVRFPAFYKQPKNKNIELRLKNKEGDSFDAELTGYLLHQKTTDLIENIPACLLVIIADISVHKRMEHELELAAIVFRNSDAAIMITDVNGKILKTNASFTKITGYETYEVVGRPSKILQSGHQDRAFYRSFWKQLKKEGNWCGEIWNRRKNGETYAEYLNINGVVDKFGRTSHYIAIFSDITQRKKDEEKIKQLAHYDILTKLPNRVLFEDRLRQSILHAARYKQYLSIFFLDLDHFKNINDSLGHSAGDILLQEVAKRIKHCVRQTDTIARFGGDEFVILLTNFSDEQCATIQSAEISKNILDEISKPFDIAGNRFLTSASIGFALYPKNGSSINELTRNADTAMYHAKEKGRNNYKYYTDEMRSNSMARSLLEIELHSALANQEFVLHYQPQVDLQNHNKLVAVEALIRWLHPKKGLISPNDFIPILEESSLIHAVGEWILKTACQQLKEWHSDKYPDLKMSVNLSAQQFMHGEHLIEIVRRVLDEYQLPAHYLELEITETVMMENLQEASKVLGELRKLGILICLDDFGTGYSSLSYLKKFPIDVLKIDCSFVRGIPEDKDDRIIINSILAIAEQMQLNTVAEGIEKQNQADFLTRQGCHLGQGYLYSKPVTAFQL